MPLPVRLKVTSVGENLIFERLEALTATERGGEISGHQIISNKKAPTAYAVEASILVELGGVEPPSESTLPLVLHA